MVCTACNYKIVQTTFDVLGLLFWTDWDKDIPRIECADMSGMNRKVIFNVTTYKNGAWPNGLSLDYILKRLYWIDARADSIHRLSSSHVFTIPESTNFFHEIFFVLFFYKVEVFHSIAIKNADITVYYNPKRYFAVLKKELKVKFPEENSSIQDS